MRTRMLRWWSLAALVVMALGFSGCPWWHRPYEEHRVYRGEHHEGRGEERREERHEERGEEHHDERR